MGDIFVFLGDNWGVLGAIIVFLGVILRDGLGVFGDGLGATFVVLGDGFGGECQGKVGAFGVMEDGVCGFFVGVVCPDVEEVGDAGAGSFADIDQAEHFHDGLVAGVGYATCQGCLEAYADVAGVGEGDFVFGFDDDDALPGIEVGMCQAVEEDFSEREMEWGVVLSAHAFCAEGDGKVGSDAWVDLEEEVVEVAAPIAGGGDEAVGPSCVVVHFFLIVEEVVRVFADDVVFVSEHKESGAGGVESHIGIGERDGAYVA